VETSKLVAYADESERNHNENKHSTLTNDDEHPIRLLRILDFRKEARSQAEGQGYFGRLVKVSLQHVSGQMDQSRPINFKQAAMNKTTNLLKMKKLSRTCNSCLFATLRRILSWSSASVSGGAFWRRWYDSVGLTHAAGQTQHNDHKMQRTTAESIHLEQDSAPSQS
jgi:hypothetical protein